MTLFKNTALFSFFWKWLNKPFRIFGFVRNFFLEIVAVLKFLSYFDKKIRNHKHSYGKWNQWNKNLNPVDMNLASQTSKRKKQSPGGVLYEKVFLEVFAKFARKHLCQSLFFNTFLNFVKKETLAQVFSCEFWEISKNTLFIEHLRETASERSSVLKCSFFLF